MAALKKAADWIIAAEPLLLLVAVPMLLFPRGYLWQWQQGVFHYAPVEDPALRYPGILSWLGLGLVALPWGLRWLRQGRPTRPTVLDIPLAVYLATAALSLWPSVDRAHSLNFLLVLVAGAAVYYGLVNAVRSEARLGWAVGLFLAGGVALSVVGLLQTDWTALAQVLPLPAVYDWLQSLPRLLGRTLSRGITSGAAVLFIPVGLALAFAAPQRGQRALAAVATLVTTTFLFLSQSRGDILALALTIPALWLWLRRRGHVWLVCALVGLFGLMAALVLYAPDLISQVESIYPSRWQVWERAAYMIRDQPFTGIGLDTYQIVAPNVYPYFDYGWNRLPMAHNRLLQVGVDQGLLGVAAFVALVVLFYVANRRAWRAGGSRFHRGLALGLCGGFTAFLLSSLFDDGVLTSRAGLAVWFLLGLGVTQARLAAEGAGLAATAGVWPGQLGRQVRVLLPAAAVLLLGVAAVALAPVVWHNLGNVARNRGWLGVDVSTQAREANAARSLSFYERAGARAARDRGALLFLAHHPRPQDMDSSFLATVAAHTPDGQAIADLEVAVAEHPHDRFAHLYLGEAYRAAGRLSEATAEYERAGFPVEWLIAEGYRQWDWGRGDYEEAVAQLTIATLMDPNSAEAYAALGQIQARAGQFPLAVEAYERALQLNPDDAWVREELEKARKRIE